MSKEKSKIETFIESNIKVIGGVFVILIVFAALVVTAGSLNKKATEKGISTLDKIDFEFRNEGAGISESDLIVRQDKALEALEELTVKSGIVGVRANMLKADILFQKKDYEASRSAWVKAGDSKKSVYTAPICYFNAAVCSENLGDNDSAISYYSKAIKSEDFLLIDHAYFNLGRVNEAAGKTDDAVAAYEKISDLHPTSRFAAVAKSRVIAIKAAKSE